jgi:predicted DNA-binding antitoxin AbrB/MazE fold protein
MSRTVKAVYQGGVFIPEEECDLAEGTKVELEIRPYLLPPTVKDPEERKRILAEVVKSMSENPIPPDAPLRFTREELHERR